MNNSTTNTLIVLGVGALAAYLFLRPKTASSQTALEQQGSTDGGGGGGGGGFAPEGYIVPTTILGGTQAQPITVTQTQQNAPSTGEESLQYWQSRTPSNLPSTPMGTTRTQGTGGGTATRGGTSGGGGATMPVMQPKTLAAPKRFTGFLNMDAEIIDMEENL